jgi:serine/threonine protein kinase
MDKHKAKRLELSFKDSSFMGYKIIELINHGKSAAVFKAMDNSGNYVAIKIFDNELVEKFGHEIQEERISKEISLINHKILNLVRIIQGGNTIFEADKYYYIIMEFVPGFNLKQYIQKYDIDNNFIIKVVKSLFNVSQELLSKGIVHRDIKPENIMITDTSNEVILMDLGVLKFIGLPSSSDQDGKQFVGTLTYAPPEFLSRTEEDSKDGWNAVNLYQIGGVMHDLIMKKELFDGVAPYANPVISIKEDAPQIVNDKLPHLTLQLSRDLLTKNWRDRNTVCTSARIEEFFFQENLTATDLQREVELIQHLISKHKIKYDEIVQISRTQEERRVRRKEIAQQIDTMIDHCFNEIRLTNMVKSIEKSSHFFFESDHSLFSKKEVRNYFFELQGTIETGIPRTLFMLVKVLTDENSFTEISAAGIFLRDSKRANLSNPHSIPALILADQNGFNHDTRQRFSSIQTCDLFLGTVSFDQPFRNNLTLQFFKLFRASIEGVKDEVDQQLEMKKKLLNGQTVVPIPRPSTVIFNSIK